MGKIHRISVVMMWCTAAFRTFPSGTSHQRWPKRRNDEYPRVNPPLFSLCLQPSRCFPFDPHKRPLFLFPGLSIPQRSQVTLVSGRSCQCKSKHLTAIRAWWKRRPPARRLHRRLMITSSKDLLSICWCGWENTANTLRLNYSCCWGCLGERGWPNFRHLDTWWGVVSFVKGWSSVQTLKVNLNSWNVNWIISWGCHVWTCPEMPIGGVKWPIL